MAENVIVLEPGDERAQKIAKAMASQTASDILHLLGEGKKSLTEITDCLAIPLTTAKYHIENLLDAGLIIVADTKYSVKGREVKLYALANQLLIVAPRQSDMRALLLKYAALFGLVIFCTFALALVSSLIIPNGSLSAAMPPAPSVERDYTGVVAAKAAYEAGTQAAAAIPEAAVAFFFGGSMVILVLLAYEIYLWKKEKRYSK
jgi:DNA-binding transcriptional ArsR family regulator